MWEIIPKKKNQRKYGEGIDYLDNFQRPVTSNRDARSYYHARATSTYRRLYPSRVLRETDEELRGSRLKNGPFAFSAWFPPNPNASLLRREPFPSHPAQHNTTQHFRPKMPLRSSTPGSGIIADTKEARPYSPCATRLRPVQYSARHPRGQYSIQ